MLFVLFQLDGRPYALEAAQVVEVVPLVAITGVPHAPVGVAGIVEYHGSPVPVIDLSQLIAGRAARVCLSTRIIVVDYPAGAALTRRLGLIAERVTETMRRDPGDFVDGGIASDGAGYLGPVAPSPRGLVQWVHVKHLLPAPVRDVLFRQAVA